VEQNRTKWLDYLATRPERKCGRYAPSPSGELHLGNLQTAILAYLQCRAMGGVFVMRMEDVDAKRVVPGSAEGILGDLKTIQIRWDEGPQIGGPYGPYVQSQRSDIYESALLFLKEKGLLFPCFCTRKEIKIAAQNEPGKTIVYPGTCRDLSLDEQKEKGKTRSPSWRFRVPDTKIKVQDRLCGAFSSNLKTDVGDFVLKRADGIYSYQIAVVVDDILMGISDIVRGEDLLESIPRQGVLFQALETPRLPNFWHVPLLKNKEGEKLSKRNDSAGLARYLEKHSIEDLFDFFCENLGVPKGSLFHQRSLEDLFFLLR